MTDRARLYFEAHITVKAKEPEFWRSFARDARQMDWRASKFDVDEVDHYDGAWFLSARAKSLREMKERVRNMLQLVQRNNYEVVRWKIEDTVLDSKLGDGEDTLS